MFDRLARIVVFALYQFSVVLGILLLPVALLAHRAGVSLPMGGLIDRLDAAYRRRVPDGR